MTLTAVALIVVIAGLFWMMTASVGSASLPEGRFSS
jgi:hypothetical protein